MVLAQRASGTITERTVLREELARTRERGFSIDDVENEEGIRCAGAPVFDHAGHVQAGISVAGPATRMTLKRLAEIGPILRQKADAISRQVGFAIGNEPSEVPS
jgi:IclR family acetate operon transcriptional repressor